LQACSLLLKESEEIMNVHVLHDLGLQPLALGRVIAGTACRGGGELKTELCWADALLPCMALLLRLAACMWVVSQCSICSTHQCSTHELYCGTQARAASPSTAAVESTSRLASGTHAYATACSCTACTVHCLSGSAVRCSLMHHLADQVMPAQDATGCLPSHWQAKEGAHARPIMYRYLKSNNLIITMLCRFSVTPQRHACQQNSRATEPLSPVGPTHSHALCAPCPKASHQLNALLK